jgi:uncharacterized DUF497 family protein
MNPVYDWEKDKEEINLEKHGFSFEEASTAFEDPNALVEENCYEVYGEKRSILVGLSSSKSLLFVVYTQNEGGTWIKIISARLALGNKKKEYWEQFKF